MKRVAIVLAIASIMTTGFLGSLFPANAVAPAPTLQRGSAELLAAASATDALAFIVTFDAAADREALLLGAGLTPKAVFESFPVAYAAGVPSAWNKLAGETGVIAIEPDEAQEYYLQTAVHATRAREVNTGAVGLVGNLQGAGVGIAVVDSGIDCEHPDLAAQCVPGRNLQLVYGTTLYVNVGNSDWHIGHGTHVAGIIAGDGTASGGLVKGVAPKASLYGYGQGIGASIFNYLAAWNHILANPAAPGYPPIKIVSNSFGGVGSPTAATTTAVRALVGAGITVVAAAGNDGDDGAATDNVNHICKVKDANGNPLAGLICVANYADGQVGSSEGGLDLSTSRGAQASPLDWPDVAAPGNRITAARASTGAVVSTPAFATDYGTTDLEHYITISGTSMACPHVSGVIALMQEARAKAGLPLLTPAEVESTLKATTHKFANYAPYPNRHAGSGLVDARAAVESALGLAPSAMTPALQVPTNDLSGIVFSGTVQLLNLGAGSSTGNSVSELEGFGSPFPATDYVTPGSTSVRVRGFFYDAGGVGLGVVHPSAKVTATITYLGSGTVITTGPFTPAGDPVGTYFNSATYPYAWPVDGDVHVAFTFDLNGDGVMNPYSDGTATTVYTVSP